MIQLKRITDTEDSFYSYIEQLIKSSFPPEEYREIEELQMYTAQKQLFHNNIIITPENNPVGMLSYWDFDEFCYVEHFAIDSAQRNSGYGKRVLDHLKNILQRPIVLEVEMPETKIAHRRIEFYKRQGFTLWEESYLQPPYREGESYLPMLLMVQGELDCEKDYKRVKECIYKDVYNALALNK